MTEAESRWAHLLQPIRELGANWDVDIAADLGDYLAELEQVVFTFDGGHTALNFAEAAMVIQGSACVYSRKVEHLHRLVYQALHAVAASKRRDAANGDDGGADMETGGQEPDADDVEAFLSLDDCLEEGTGIDLDDEYAASHAVAARRPDTAFWALRNNGKDGSSENATSYKICGCAVHFTGALLLDARDAALLNEHLTFVTSYVPVAPLASAAAAAHQGPAGDVPMQDADNADIPGNDEFDYGGGGGGYDDDDLAPAGDTGEQVPTQEGAVAETAHHQAETAVPQPQQAEQPAAAEEPQQEDEEEEEEEADPWAPLDYDDAGALPVRPFRKGRTFRAAPPAPPRSSAEAEARRAAALGAVFPEFAYAYEARAADRKRSRFAAALRQGSRGGGGAGAGGGDAAEMFRSAHAAAGGGGGAVAAAGSGGAAGGGDLDDVDADADWGGGYGGGGGYEDDDDFGGCAGVFAPLDSEALETAAGEGAALLRSQLALEERERAAAALAMGAGGAEGLLGQGSAAAVRAAIDAAASERSHAELAARVAAWKAKVEPAIEAQDARGTFDIHSYGAAFLDRAQLAGSDAAVAGGLFVPFSAVVAGQPGPEVARAFSAMLQLVNAGNVGVLPVAGVPRDGSQGDAFHVAVLNTRMAHLRFEDYLAPSQQAQLAQQKQAPGAGGGEEAAAAPAKGKGKKKQPAAVAAEEEVQEEEEEEAPLPPAAAKAPRAKQAAAKGGKARRQSERDAGSSSDEEEAGASSGSDSDSGAKKKGGKKAAAGGRKKGAAAAGKAAKPPAKRRAALLPAGQLAD